MRFLNFFGIGKKRKQKNQYQRILICFFFITIILLNCLYSNEIVSTHNDSVSEFNPEIPKAAVDISMLQNPFTRNFSLIRDFFENNYQSSLDLNISTYFRYGDNSGTIIDDTIFSEDNLLYYKSLKKPEITPTETFETYLRLKSNPLWYEGNYDQYKYGFVKSIDNSTSQVLDDNRYLIDNVLPIFLLIENIGDKIDDISINGKLPHESIEEMFELINSTEFWDEINTGFYHYNLSNTKYTESNFYTILTNLQIHRIYWELGLDDNIEQRAFQLANQTMLKLIEKMWDTTNLGFYHDASNTWSTGGPGQADKFLNVNALGIITLLDFYIKTGMSNSTYLSMAEALYRKLDEELWNGEVYEYRRTPDWGSSIPIEEGRIDLEANAIMMSACLKLFEITGNITYYNRATQFKLYESFEEDFYDKTYNAYKTSVGGTLPDDGKNLHANLKLTEAYLSAYEIYNNTILTAVYNLTESIPNFVFNQDVMNLTSTYSYNKLNQYYNPLNDSYVPFTVECEITNVSINHLFKYPNGTYLKQFENQIVDPATSYTHLYPIEETLPIGDGYFIYIWANTSYFKMAQILKQFNVISGLINTEIIGLVSTLYQGQILNVSLVINYTRKDNLNLTVSLEGDNIKNYPPQEINFTTFEVIQISFNLTAKTGAIPGTSEIFFKIKKGNVFYLEVKRIIEVGFSFDYSNLIYQSEVVPGDDIFVSMNLKNFLPNATQSLNVSFTGRTQNWIEDFIKEEILSENEIKTVSYSLKSLKSIINDTIEIKMSILINKTEYYSEIFDVEIIPKYELISVSFPESIPQGVHAYLIIIIQNNQENSELFSLYVNGERVSTNIAELNTGENRILAQIMPTINPYEFGVKKYRIVLKDSLDEEIGRFYFEVTLELSTLNLVIFYLLPIIIPIGIILYFKNKDIKHKKLRR
ncbi:MAG: hypothetical protein JSV23_00710 [Promethearchaeota archaeon]|nr:MAG: hypothetical protein JSV23_00710 [Candidatus Lokiarchaeota archaeon]